LIAGTVLMSQLSISSLNDWADRQSDAAAGRWRPVAMGRIPPNAALGLAVLFAVFSLLGALALGTTATVVVFLGLVTGWAYDLWLKPTPLSFIPFAIAFPLLVIWVGIVGGRSLPALLLFFLVGAPLATAIHLADALPDRASDAATRLRTLAVTLGAARAIRAMQATLLLGSLVAVASVLDRPAFAVMLGVTAAIGTALATATATHQPSTARWVVSATALAMALSWMAAHANV